MKAAYYIFGISICCVNFIMKYDSFIQRLGENNNAVIDHQIKRFLNFCKEKYKRFEMNWIFICVLKLMWCFSVYD